MELGTGGVESEWVEPQKGRARGGMKPGTHEVKVESGVGGVGWNQGLVGKNLQSTKQTKSSTSHKSFGRPWQHSVCWLTGQGRVCRALGPELTYEYSSEVGVRPAHGVQAAAMHDAVLFL